MKLRELYEKAVECGMKNDPRHKKALTALIARNKKAYRSLKGRYKASFDKESLFNPYGDTRILYGEPDREIKVIMVGIDMETGELLIADRFKQAGSGVDLVISHHPEGRAYAELHKVMGLQTDRLKELGIAPDVAEEIMGERIAEVARKLHAANCMRSIDAARMLDVPYMCVHTAADNMVNSFLRRLIDKNRPKTVGALLESLSDIYEYREGAKAGIGPVVLIGDRRKPAGRIFVDMTGGTEGSKRVFARLSQIGIGTIVCMHLSEEHYKLAKKEHINIVIAGHIPSDSIGLNLILDELLKNGDLSIIPCAGFIRHSRL